MLTRLVLLFLTLNVFSENFYVVRKIVIKGNKKTKERIILREVPFSAGDTIYSSNLSKILQTTEDNLKRTALFNFVNVDTSNTIDNTVEIYINVIERWYFWPIPIFEQASRNINAWLYEKDYSKINFGLFLLQANFRGNNELLRGIVTFGFKERYGFAYTVPEFLGLKRLGIEVKALHYQQKKVPYMILNNKPVYFFYENKYLYHNEHYEITLKFRPFIYYYHNFVISFENHNIDDTLFSLNENFLLEKEKNIKILNFSYLFLFNKTNSVSYPTRGLKYQLQLSLDKFFENSNYNPSFTGSFANYLNITKNLNFAYGIHFKYSFLNKKSYIFSKCLGYQYFVRGMELYEIPGNGFFISSNSLRYRLWHINETYIKFLKSEKFSKSYFSLFLSFNADLGYVISYDNYPMTNELLYGYGIGINIVTYYDIAIKIDFSINKMNEKKIFFHFYTFI